MILQALYSYYQRIKDRPDVATYGFARQKCHFCLVLSRDGGLVQVKDIRDSSGKKPVATELIVPILQAKRTSGVNSCFLSDNTGYVLGADDKGKPDRAADQHAAFITLHEEIARNCPDDGLHAMLAFLHQWQSAQAGSLPMWEHMCGTNLVFQLESCHEYVHDRPALQRAWLDYLQKEKPAAEAWCLITGKHSCIAELHLPIKGLAGAQTSGASLCAFNLDAFCSLGKTQNLNAPVSPHAAFAYVTALNQLLRFGSCQRTRIADSTVVFWTERASAAEGFFGLMLNPTDSPADLQQVRTVLDAARTGRWPAEIEPDLPFYILGLAPNAARISVRFWLVASVAEMVDRLQKHFGDLQIARSLSKDTEFPATWQLLRETALQQKTENIPPLLAGALMRAILTGGEYPLAFYSAILKRIRADHTINYFRAAALKAYLVRHYRVHKQPKEVPVSLDPNNNNPGYLLGRLFALLEKAQLDALCKVDATIKDRYYGAASSTPRAVFPILLRLAQHHIAKADYGAARDKEIQAVVNELAEFPAHLSLEDQGLFAIGYYHQRHAFYNKTTAQGA
jgi:CRISPR-associated protein Csd1